ncbi:hypothetical protein DF3PA_70127 [Candidatus Defluviicoccus seviourii]|uniref:DUF3168 domain-containing protein n=1 Tax=Candidatus Defluviicoccus seviourii TaxID=2565273 RepID=A0A564WH79_9PROT|nr:hypothetical protein DF3PA_70127 [Candidatus Defluviicoccus seviourii]
MILDLLSHMSDMITDTLPATSEVFFVTTPPDASFPYAVIQYNQTPDDTKTSYGHKIFFEIHLWYNSYDMSAIVTQVEELRSALHDTYYTSGGTTHYLSVTSTHLFDDPSEDFLVNHGILRVTAANG